MSHTAISVKTSQSVRSHGKEPKGQGAWAFGILNDLYFDTGSYSQAESAQGCLHPVCPARRIPSDSCAAVEAFKPSHSDKEEWKMKNPIIVASGTSLDALKLIALECGVSYPRLHRQPPKAQRALVIEALKAAGLEVRGH